MRRPTTSSHYTRSGTTASIRSGTAASVSLRTTGTTSSGTGAARPFTARGGGGSISIRPGKTKLQKESLSLYKTHCVSMMIYCLLIQHTTKR